MTGGHAASPIDQAQHLCPLLEGICPLNHKSIAKSTLEGRIRRQGQSRMKQTFTHWKTKRRLAFQNDKKLPFIVIAVAVCARGGSKAQESSEASPQPNFLHRVTLRSAVANNSFSRSYSKPPQVGSVTQAVLAKGVP